MLPLGHSVAFAEDRAAADAAIADIDQMFVQAPAPTATTTPVAPTRTEAERQDTIEVLGQKRSSEIALEQVQFGNQVQTVTAEEIAGGGYTNFAEISQGLIKGANIGYSPDEGEYTIRLDGGGDRDTLVTLDGMPLYDRGPGVEDIWGATLIDPHMIETVEVFRGGQSLYFGSNAGIGLVNVVTKKPDGTTKGEFGVSYGSFDTRDIWGNYTFPVSDSGRHALMFYGSRQGSEGPQLFSREAQTDNHLATGGITDFTTSRDSTGIKYLWVIDDRSNLNADVIYVESFFQDTFPNTTIYGPTRVRMPAVNLQYDRDWNGLVSTDVKVSYRRPTLFNTKFVPQVCRDPAGCPQPSNPDNVVAFGDATGNLEPQVSRGIGDESIRGGFEELVVTVLNRIRFSESIALVAGVQSTNYRDVSDARVTIDDDLVSSNALIADLQLNPSFSPGTSVSVAVRFENEASFGNETLGKFGLRHTMGNGFYLRANGGTSFSLPRTNELFFDSETVIGNPDLKPEKTETLNFGGGFERELNGRVLALDIGGFMTDVKDRIQTTQGLTPNTRFNNDAVTEIRGWVVDAQYQFNDNWSASASYTRTDAELEDSNRQINATPVSVATGSLRYRSDSDRWHLTLLPRLQGDEFIQAPAVSGLPDLNYGDWFAVDGSVQYWLGNDRQHRLQLRVANLLDEAYGQRGAFGNQFYGSAFIRGEFTNQDPEYFYPYVFQAKKRSFFVTYSTTF